MTTIFRGAKVRRSLSIYPTPEGQSNRRLRDGTVVYVHPEGRFYVVEFQLGKNRLRETFYPDRMPEPISKQVARPGGYHRGLNL